MKWIKKAFNRTIILTDDVEKEIGSITFELFESKVNAQLNGKKYIFDISGFIEKNVAIFDESNTQIGNIALGFRAKAVATLSNGEIYVWKKNDFFLRNWELIHDLPNTDNDPVILNFERTRHFFEETGSVKILEKIDNQELVILIGFFVGMYFIRRRRRVAGMAGIVAIA